MSVKLACHHSIVVRVCHAFMCFGVDHIGCAPNRTRSLKVLLELFILACGAFRVHSFSKTTGHSFSKVTGPASFSKITGRLLKLCRVLLKLHFAETTFAEISISLKFKKLGFLLKNQF